MDKKTTYKITIVNEQTGKVEREESNLDCVVSLTKKINDTGINTNCLIHANAKIVGAFCIRLEALRRELIKENPALMLMEIAGLLVPDNEDCDCDKCNDKECKNNKQEETDPVKDLMSSLFNSLFDKKN